MKTMVARSIGNVAVAVHRTEMPTDAEWGAFVEILRAADERGELARQRILAVTDGARPNALQRKVFTDLLAGRMLPTAVVTDSALARGVVTALSWFNPMTRAFAPDDLAGALAFLGVDAADRAAVTRAVDEARAELGAPRRIAG